MVSKGKTGTKHTRRKTKAGEPMSPVKPRNCKTSSTMVSAEYSAKNHFHIHNDRITDFNTFGIRPQGPKPKDDLFGISDFNFISAQNHTLGGQSN